ncbi:hypothetical protein M408DRAFT_27717 [Serendipita vermifera MAFF 305830]|uniref:XPG-I domain-containing protein n=1 Tax=Serendipita vermifera MAFF 305830 TaxID=933852 RepID=A0A0C2X2H4_SERVB|nr:hypothetical protein M408DRAFT_27717 [Serendipita vermifera MAFF 305830]
MGAQHPLTGSFKTMIHAFGFEYHQAPGEAEAELAYLNRIEVIDAVLSDDVDNFLFGATLVMRNPSATLSGNKKHVMKNADGKQDDKHVLLFSSKRIFEDPDIRLQHGGFILIGLLSGGDYDTGGLFKCGIKTSHGLARAGLGESLIKAYTETPAHALPAAMSAWRDSMCRYLATDPEKLIGRKNKALAASIPDSFPPIDVLEAYIRPVTSESIGHVPNFEWARQPSLKEIANRCEIHYEWGVKPLIIKRFRTVIWPGALMRVLRAAVMQGDEKERRQVQGMQPSLMFTPTNGRRAADMAVGTPSRLITQCLSRLELQSPQKGRTLGRTMDPFSDEYEPTPDDEPLMVKIHSKRTHASTDGVLEYRVEIAPAQFVRMTEEGLLNIRDEDSIDVANFGRRKALIDDEEDFGDADDDGPGRKGKQADKPNDHMRIWVPACMLEMVEPTIVEEFEGITATKEQKKKDKEQRAKDKAEGKVSPKKSRKADASSPSKSRAKKANAPITEDDSDLSPSAAKTPKAIRGRKYVSGDSSDEDADSGARGNMPKPLNLYSMPSYASSSSRKEDDVSGSDYMSTESVTNRRLMKNVGPTRSLPPTTSRPPVPPALFPNKSAGPSTGPSTLRTKSAKSDSLFPKVASTSSSSSSRNFIFTMKPDVYELDASDEEDDLDPYAALSNPTGAATTSKPANGSVGGGGKPRAKHQANNTGRIDMDFDEASPVRRPQQADESMEDFSHLFPPSPSKEDDISARTTVNAEPANKASTTKRRTKFVSNTDSSDEEPRPAKVTKKPKAQKPPPAKPLAYLGIDLEVEVPVKEKQSTSTRPAKPKAKVSKPETVKTPPVTEVIELSDSSVEEVPQPMPTKKGTKNPVSRKNAPKVAGSQTLPRSGRAKGGDVSLIDLDDSS